MCFQFHIYFYQGSRLKVADYQFPLDPYDNSLGFSTAAPGSFAPVFPRRRNRTLRSGNRARTLHDQSHISKFPALIPIQRDPLRPFFAVYSWLRKIRPLRSGSNVDSRTPVSPIYRSSTSSYKHSTRSSSLHAHQWRHSLLSRQ